jgi:hypothetical protein
MSGLVVNTTFHVLPNPLMITLERILAAPIDVDPKVIASILDHHPLDFNPLGPDRSNKEAEFLIDLVDCPKLHFDIRRSACRAVTRWLRQRETFLLPADGNLRLLRFMLEYALDLSGPEKDFLSYCCSEMRGRRRTFNPILVTHVLVKQGEFNALTIKAKENWAAIPFLWKLVTTLADGKRITLAEAFQLRHELHSASTLIALYAQASETIPDLETVPGPLDWRLASMLSWPPTPAVDAPLVTWFHGPYLAKAVQLMKGDKIDA